jgi:hypothetical protein
VAVEADEVKSHTHSTSVVVEEFVVASQQAQSVLEKRSLF